MIPAFKFGAVTLISAMLVLANVAQPAVAACRQALALGLDVSSSVDRAEYTQQMLGVASALLDTEVQQLLLSSPSAPVAIAVFEWGGRGDQKILLDWHLIEGPEDIQLVANVFLNKTVYTRTSLTALGQAIIFGANLLNRSPDCWQLTLDISADGKSNQGDAPLVAKMHPVFNNATINGLIIGSADGAGRDKTHARITEMVNYFKSQVIHGPGSFVQVAKGYGDYGVAMRQKLLRELQINVSEAAPVDQNEGG